MENWIDVCKTSDLTEGQVKIFEAEGHRIALCHPKAEEFYAVQDVCTHDNGPLGEGELMDYAIECPRHGARFDVRSGKVLALPAVVPIKTFPVKIENNQIKVAL